METLNTASGLPSSVFAGDNVPQQSNLFRPWTEKESKSEAHVSLVGYIDQFKHALFDEQTLKLMYFNFQAPPVHGELSGNLPDANHLKPPQVVHPVK